MEEDLYQRGLAVRRRVQGAAAVDARIGAADRYTRLLDDMETEFVWGLVWSRPGLSVGQRRLLTIAMMVASNRPAALREEIAGALEDGHGKEEIVEVLLHANAYCGGPAGVDAFRAAREVFARYPDAPEGEARP